jgi:FkbM family methyltransferase
MRGATSRLLGMQTLRRILTHPLVEPQVATLLRARLVDRPVRFALREWGLQRGAFGYRVRENGMRVVVAHRSGDVHALDQSFYAHSHEPPAGARAALEALPHPVRALDVGANVGMIARFDGAQVIALEPDPSNVVRHRRQISLNDLGSRWEVRAQAATVTGGSVQFAVGEGTNGAILTDERAGAEVDGVDVFSLLDGIDLLKLDIEGGEWPILADPRFPGLSVPVVMLEYHADGAPADPGASACEALERAGYVTESMDEFRPGFGTVWGYRR